MIMINISYSGSDYNTALISCPIPSIVPQRCCSKVYQLVKWLQCNGNRYNTRDISINSIDIYQAWTMFTITGFMAMAWELSTGTYLLSFAKEPTQVYINILVSYYYYHWYRIPRSSGRLQACSRNPTTHVPPYYISANIYGRPFTILWSIIITESTTHKLKNHIHYMGNVYNRRLYSKHDHDRRRIQVRIPESLTALLNSTAYLSY